MRPRHRHRCRAKVLGNGNPACDHSIKRRVGKAIAGIGVNPRLRHLTDHHRSVGDNLSALNLRNIVFKPRESVANLAFRLSGSERLRHAFRNPFRDGVGMKRPKQ